MRISHIFLGIVIAFLWAGNLIASNVASSYLPPFILATLRFTIVVVCILPFYWRTLPSNWKQLALVSQLWGAIYFAFFFMGFYLGAESGVASLMILFTTPLTALLGRFFLNEKISAFTALGIGCAFVGLVIMKDSPNLLSAPLGSLLILGAALSWAITNIVLKKTDKQGISPIALTGWLSLFSIPLLLLLSFITHLLHFIPSEWIVVSNIQTIPTDLIIAVMFMSMIVTIFVNSMWVYLLRHNNASNVAIFNLLIPLFASLLGYIILNENLAPKTLLGGGIIMGGLAIIIIHGIVNHYVIRKKHCAAT